jgi:hypothetical protein
MSGGSNYRKDSVNPGNGELTAAGDAALFISGSQPPTIANLIAIRMHCQAIRASIIDMLHECLLFFIS